MIFNLANYLITEFPSYNFTVNGFGPGTGTEAVSINQTGGEAQHFYERKDYSVQILARSLDNVTGKTIIDTIYEKLENVFHLELDAVTVDGVVYPAVQTAQISPIEIPQSLGIDDNGRWLWVFNLIIVV